MMLSKTRRLAVMTAAVLAVSAGIPVTASQAAAGPCQAVVSQSTGSEVAIVLEGHYRWPKSNTADVTLTCHLVQNGVKVVSVTDPMSGHIAATISDQRLGTDPYYVCYSLRVTEGVPWNPIFSTTNC